MNRTNTLAAIIHAVSPESTGVPSCANTVAGTEAIINPRIIAVMSFRKVSLINCFISFNSFFYLEFSQKL